MKRFQLTQIMVLGLLIFFVACKESNLPEAIPIQLPKVGTPEYYANLRAYKKTKHQVAFGWFGNSGGDGKTALMGLRWESIPDSTDIVSCWGGMPVYNSPQFHAMQKVRSDKGTKVVWVEFSHDSYLKKFGGKDFIEKYTKGDDKLLIEGFALVAKSMKDSIEKYKIDGFDFDHEPEDLLTDTRKFGLLIKEVSRYFGPKSGTGRLLIIDGYVGYLPEEYSDCIDYGVQQLYGVTSPGALQGYFFSSSRKPKNLPSSKVIIAETYEAGSGWATGGPYPFKDPVRGTIPAILGYAYWQPPGETKGGVGAYHAEYEYASPIPYKYFRQMIQVMNPAVK
ncbi:glycoside hydrolase family 18 [Sphingobacterium spiritivorum]|uniref:glycoside hydrolase family 18 n=1 Tax=Sphingobacterium spiritivorum TaxID=258 RepID=UPI003DA5B268